MKDLRLYILMRTDMDSMKAGRAAAQASHASNAFIWEHPSNKNVKEWQRQTSQGFGTAIVLAGKSSTINQTLKDIESANNILNTPEAVFNKVVDPDYVIVVTPEVARLMNHPSIFQIDDNLDTGMTAIHRREWTCAYVFGDKEFLNQFLKDYPLYS